MTDPRHDTIDITVNGRLHQVAADPNSPLLYILRNDLQLNSVRFGCGISRCGACAVLLDGTPARSCAVSVGDAAGREIVTLEGLGTPDNLHPLQQAFLDEQAGQCGYCLPGMIVEAANLLERNTNPTEQEIRAALDGTLCRCGAHARIVRAVHRAAGTQT